MKKLTFIIAMALMQISFGQQSTVSPINDISDANNVMRSGAGVWIKNNPTDTNIDGSPYLFDNWHNMSRIQTDDKIYKLFEFNYNIIKERFEAKFSNDSVLVINTGNVKEVTINDITLKPYYDNSNGRVSFFEEIAQINDMVIIKQFKVKIKEGSFNPMTQKRIKNDTYVKEEVYFVKIEGQEDLESIKLKKSSILALFDKDKQDKLKDFVKEKKLSFKDEDDLQTILRFSSTI